MAKYDQLQAIVAKYVGNSQVRLSVDNYSLIWLSMLNMAIYDQFWQCISNMAKYSTLNQIWTKMIVQYVQ